MYSWTEHTAVRQRNWKCIATSTDGIRLVAAVNPGYIYTSSNYGSSWAVNTSAGYRQWQLLASDAAGMNLIAAVTGEYLYTSTDYGSTWIARTGPGINNWSSVDISDNGSIMFALAQSGTLYKSINFGANWTSCSVNGRTAMACSANGEKIITITNGGYISLSSDFGAGNERVQSVPGIQNWSAVACSADGLHIAVALNTGYIYTTNDFGVHWIVQNGCGSRAWQAIAMDDDGSRLIAITDGTGYIYHSEDGGITWNPQANTNKTWNSIALSAAGTNLAASVNGGYLYTAILDTTSFNTQQVENLTALTNIASNDNTVLSTVLETINTELTVPLQLGCTSDNLFTITVGSNVLVNLDTHLKRALPPVGGVIPAFAGGTIIFPSAVGGTITISPGVNIIMPDIGASNFVKIGVSINGSGEIKLLFGTPASSEISATIPNNPTDIGYITISTDSSNNINPIDHSNINQYIGSSNNAGATYAPASATEEGIVTTTTQTFAGDKTLVGSTTFNGNLNVNYGINGNAAGALSNMLSGILGNVTQFESGQSWPSPGSTLGCFSGGVLLPPKAGRGPTVFLIPDRYTGTKTLYSVQERNFFDGPPGPAVASGHAFIGGILMRDGNVFCIPWTYTGTSNIFKPGNITALQPGPPNLGAYAFQSGVSLPNGKVFFVASYYTGTTNIYNPSTNAWEAGLLESTPDAGSSPFSKGVLLPNNKILLVPYNYTGTKYIYNITTQAFEDGPSLPSGNGKFSGGVLLPSGKVFCSANMYTGTKVIYNPSTNAWEDGPAKGTDSIISGILLSNGKVFCAPLFAAPTFTKTIYNPITNAWEDGPSNPGNSFTFTGAVLLPDGNVLCVPGDYTGTSTLYRPATSGWPYGRWMLYANTSSGT